MNQAVTRVKVSQCAFHLRIYRFGTLAAQLLSWVQRDFLWQRIVLQRRVVTWLSFDFQTFIRARSTVIFIEGCINRWARVLRCQKSLRLRLAFKSLIQKMLLHRSSRKYCLTLKRLLLNRVILTSWGLGEVRKIILGGFWASKPLSTRPVCVISPQRLYFHIYFF